MYKDLKNNIINTSYQLFMEMGMIKQPLMIYVKLVQLQKQPFIDILILKKNYFLNFFDDINERIDELRTNAKNSSKLCSTNH